MKLVKISVFAFLALTACHQKNRPTPPTEPGQASTGSAPIFSIHGKGLGCGLSSSDPLACLRTVCGTIEGAAFDEVAGECVCEAAGNNVRIVGKQGTCERPIASASGMYHLRNAHARFENEDAGAFGETVPRLNHFGTIAIYRTQPGDSARRLRGGISFMRSLSRSLEDVAEIHARPGVVMPNPLDRDSALPSSEVYHLAADQSVTQLGRPEDLVRPRPEFLAPRDEEISPDLSDAIQHAYEDLRARTELDWSAEFASRSGGCAAACRLAIRLETRSALIRATYRKEYFLGSVFRETMEWRNRQGYRIASLVLLPGRGVSHVSVLMSRDETTDRFADYDYQGREIRL